MASWQGGRPRGSCAASLRHELRPRGLWSSRLGRGRRACGRGGLPPVVRCSQISHRPARSRVISSFAAGGGRDWLAVGEDRLLLPFERYAAEPGDQWFPALRSTVAWKHVRGPCGVSMVALYLRGHLRHRRAVLAGQGLEHRGLHDPVQPVESADVTGQQVVLDDAPVLGPVGADDGVVVVVHQLGSARGFAALEVGGALGLDHRPGHAQPDRAVDRPLAAGDLVVVVLDGDLVAEEPRRAGAGVGDQRLVLGQFQLEVVTQELPRGAP